MQIEWMYGLLGGGLIGMSGALYLLTNGKIMDVSTILAGVLDRSGRATLFERLAFLAGLILVPGVFTSVVTPQEPFLQASPMLVAVAGGMVGLGARLSLITRIGMGQISFDQLQFKIILAVILFLVTAFATFYMVQNEMYKV